ncbi:MFS transporter [Brevibacillus fulvus]|uniref:MFS family permease n=1 Tax=Brevibacillus fulvus TaxID=1125967 RepID=A0A938Y0C9_9BACL|nr:MFS transporter [Brevibacillus fulvus]MBM7591041.1 MFS family permease [Brevibacillus fulvus]
MHASRHLFWILIIVVAIAGANQGLTLPLLAILLEEQGVSSLANGFNAAALYIGVFLVSPFLEIPLRRIGYRSTIICGLGLLMVATVALPFFSSLTVWFMMRLLMGIGDSSMHYASQMWVTQIAAPERRGRDISLYGLAYGIGFSVGPLGLSLLQFGKWMPFVALCLLYMIAFLLVFTMKNAFPLQVQPSSNKENRYLRVIRMGWLALIPAFLYGFMEASLNGSFPVYALRVGISVDMVSYILPAFVVGSIMLQIPLGILSDKLGRQKVMTGCALIGGTLFTLFPLAEANVWLMMLLLALAGAVVGSFYSLGLAFSADILPAGMVPVAGIIASINFSIGSIVAPNINGLILETGAPSYMFPVMGMMILLFAVLSFFFRREKAIAHELNQ